MFRDQSDKWEELRRKSANGWRFARAGQVDEALRSFQEMHSLDPNESTTMELGVAYLWFKDYEAAWRHFHNAVLVSRYTIDIYYGMAGVAKWCIGDEENATRQWRKGLHCQYADGAGGVRIPLLLYCASVLVPSTIARAEITDILMKRAKDARAKNWPGPILEYVLGWLDESGLRAKCAGVHDADTATRHWLANFYVAIVEKDRKNSLQFTDAMSATVAAVLDDDIPDAHIFPDRLWSVEFFIARRETERVF